MLKISLFDILRIIRLRCFIYVRMMVFILTTIINMDIMKENINKRREDL